MGRSKANNFIVVAVVCIILLCLFTIVRLQMQFNELNNTRKEMESQVADYKEAIEKKQNEYEQEMDDEYIIRIAREKLGFHLPDEIVYYNDLN